MRKAVAVALVASLLAAGCSASAEPEVVPVIDDSTEAQLQARAFQRACVEVICAGAPIYAPDSTPELVRQAIVTQFSNEVQYLSESELEQRTEADGRFANGATRITVRGVHSTERVDVKGVDVDISKGPLDFTGRTYLFRWNGGQWVDASPDSVNVTVTSSVS